MTILEHTDSSCMRLGTTPKFDTQGHRKVEGIQLPAGRKIRENLRGILTKKQIRELLFENCFECGKMAAIPQGAFAACKVRANRDRSFLTLPNEEREKPEKESTHNPRSPLEGWELTPLKYNSKLMNSIWGLYNRYSVHNFKKNTDSDEAVSRRFATVCSCILESSAPVVTKVMAADAAIIDSSVVTKDNGI